MAKRSSLVVALVVLAVAGVGVGAAQLGLLNDGIEFPDGTIQMTAAETPGEFVQVSASLVIPDMADCATGNIYTVPAQKKLRIEFISMEIDEFGDSSFAPVEVNINTTLGGVQVSNWLVRLADAMAIGSSLIPSVRWSSQVTLYNQGNATVQMLVCRDTSTDGTEARVTLQGQLFDE